MFKTREYKISVESIENTDKYLIKCDGRFCIENALIAESKIADNFPNSLKELVSFLKDIIGGPLKSKLYYIDIISIFNGYRINLLYEIGNTKYYGAMFFSNDSISYVRYDSVRSGICCKLDNNYEFIPDIPFDLDGESVGILNRLVASFLKYINRCEKKVFEVFIDTTYYGYKYIGMSDSTFANGNTNAVLVGEEEFKDGVNILFIGA